MPGERPKAVEDCVKSMKRDNPNVEEKIAWATCHKMYNEGKLGNKSQSTEQECECFKTTEATILYHTLEKRGHTKPMLGVQRLSSEMQGCVFLVSKSMMKMGYDKVEAEKEAKSRCKGELHKMMTLYKDL